MANTFEGYQPMTPLWRTMLDGAPFGRATFMPDGSLPGITPEYPQTVEEAIAASRRALPAGYANALAELPRAYRGAPWQSPVASDAPLYAPKGGYPHLNHPTPPAPPIAADVTPLPGGGTLNEVPSDMGGWAMPPAGPQQSILGPLTPFQPLPTAPALKPSWLPPPITASLGPLAGPRAPAPAASPVAPAPAAPPIVPPAPAPLPFPQPGPGQNMPPPMAPQFMDLFNGAQGMRLGYHPTAGRFADPMTMQGLGTPNGPQMPYQRQSMAPIPQPFQMLATAAADPNASPITRLAALLSPTATGMDRDSAIAQALGIHQGYGNMDLQEKIARIQAEAHVKAAEVGREDPVERAVREMMALNPLTPLEKVEEYRNKMRTILKPTPTPVPAQPGQAAPTTPAPVAPAPVAPPADPGTSINAMDYLDILKAGFGGTIQPPPPGDALAGYKLAFGDKSPSTIDTGAMIQAILGKEGIRKTGMRELARRLKEVGVPAGTIDKSLQEFLLHRAAAAANYDWTRPGQKKRPVVQAGPYTLSPSSGNWLFDSDRLVGPGVDKEFTRYPLFGHSGSTIGMNATKAGQYRQEAEAVGQLLQAFRGP